MKKETKELIDWIKDSLNSYITASFDTFANTPAKNNFQRKNCNKAITFLDSLPEIESHLCRGGYIQDKNGTPCCEGDKIRATTSDGSFEAQGILTWANYYFCLYDEKKGYCNHLLCSSYVYEKV